MRLQGYINLGWSPILAVVPDGAREVLQVIAWEGGTGTAPATGLYISSTGFTPTIGLAANIKGGGAATWATITGLISDNAALQGELDNKYNASNPSNFIDSAGAPVQSVAGKTGTVSLVKADVGLSNVDNISDANKPVSTAQATAIGLKANIASPTFTGTVGGITAAMVGAPSGSGTSSGTNTGDNAANSTYASDYRAANFVAGTDYVSPSGSGTGLTGVEKTANKDVSGGYAGLTALKINFKNVLGTFISFFTNSNTAARTYTFKDADGTIAFTSDITGINSGTNTGDNSANSTYASDYRAANFVAGTNYLAPNGSAALLTGFPTLNQSTSGNAATVTTNANLTGPVTSTGNATAIANGAITNAMLANGAVANLSNTNSGDNATNTLYSGLVSNANHTGDAIGSTALTLATVNSNTGSFGLADKIAQFVVNAKGLITSAINVSISIVASQVSDFTSAVNALITGKANLASPSLTGNPTAPTQTALDNSTKLATTAYTDAAVAAAGGGGGSVTLTEIEVDYGVVPISEQAFTITDGAMTGAKKILVFTSPNTATGRKGNDWEVDMAFFSAVAGTGNFVINSTSPYKMVGKRKLYYQTI